MTMFSTKNDVYISVVGVTKYNVGASTSYTMATVTE